MGVVQQAPGGPEPLHCCSFWVKPALARPTTVDSRAQKPIRIHSHWTALARRAVARAAVRRIAYEAADAGLLSPELAAGIRRVKGVRRIGVRLGNWLTPEQGRRLLECAAPSSARELRDHAMVAMLIGCGLRCAELLALRVESIQQREEHWVIADLVGKGGHVRTVPIPIWVKSTWTPGRPRRPSRAARCSERSTRPGV